MEEYMIISKQRKKNGERTEMEVNSSTATCKGKKIILWNKMKELIHALRKHYAKYLFY